ncbi:MAG: response regulator [Anaerolineales bacterium]|nr:response regulator [Anaerolineales bacterium]
MHGGSITTQSEPGRGSRFTFELPWNSKTKTLTSREPLDAADSEHNSSAQKLPAAPRKILLAEDNQSNITVTRDYLENRGYQVVVAYDGEEVLSKAEEFSPDLILMDIQMPRLNGFEAARRLRAAPQFASVPIIALTAFAMPGDRERCLEAGMNEYLSKPVRLKELVQTIEKLIGHAAS